MFYKKRSSIVFDLYVGPPPSSCSTFMALKLRLAMTILMKCRPGLVAHLGLACGSWVVVSRGTTLRSFLAPMGRTDVESVAQANCLVARWEWYNFLRTSLYLQQVTTWNPVDHSGLGGEAYSTVYVINICRFATLQVYFISFANLCAVWYMDFGTTINQPHVPTPSVSMDDQTSTSVLVIFHFPRYCRALPKKVYIYCMPSNSKGLFICFLYIIGISENMGAPSFQC